MIAAALRLRPARDAIHTRVATPPILQMEAVECGAAALASVMASFGLWAPLEQVRVATGVSRDGSKASSILKAARSYGLEAKGYRKEVGELAALGMPLIVHWNFNHFLVLEGFGRDRVHLNDPAVGSRVVTREEFEEAYTGVALRVRPGPDFRPSGARSKPLRRLVEPLSQVRPALLLIAGTALLLVAPQIAIPAFTGVFIDGVVIDGQAQWLAALVLGMVATAALRATLGLLQQRLLIRLQARLSAGASARMMWHMLRLPIAFFSQRHAGDVAQRLAANERVAELLSSGLAQALLDVLTTVLVGLVMLAYDPRLGVVAVAFVAPNLLVVWLASKRQRRISQQEAVEASKLYAATVGAVQSIETLKASGLEAQAFNRWAGYEAKLMGVAREIGMIDAWVGCAPLLFQRLATITLLWIGASRVIAGGMTVGALVAFLGLATSFADPIGRLVAMSGRFRTVQADLKRIDDTLENPLAPAGRPDPAGQTRTPRGEVKLEGVSFGYNPLDPPLIADFSLTLTPGQRVALVGGSGSGKSTIARLLAGLIQPWTGDIRLDGVSLADLTPAERARILACVNQSVFLFAGSVRDNLTLWNPAVEDRELMAALEDAALLADVLNRPGGLDAPVAEGGVNFSGGQRQRLEIARALVGDPAVLVLDEATAALDPTTELRIEEGLRRRGATCIVVAHRLSTVRDADEILVMDRGRIVERGDHRTLAAQGGEYAALIRSI